MSTKSSEKIQLRSLRDAINARLSPVEAGSVLAEVAKIEDNLNEKTQVMEMVREAIQQLKVDIKYLGFDLNATRHERDEYKQKLEDHGIL